MKAVSMELFQRWGGKAVGYGVKVVQWQAWGKGMVVRQWWCMDS